MNEADVTPKTKQKHEDSVTQTSKPVSHPLLSDPFKVDCREIKLNVGAKICPAIIFGRQDHVCTYLISGGDFTPF